MVKKKTKKDVKKSSSGVKSSGISPDKDFLLGLIKKAIKNTSDLPKEKLREYLIKEILFMVGTGVGQNVVGRVIKRKINDFSVSNSEKKQKKSNKNKSKVGKTDKIPKSISEDDNKEDVVQDVEGGGRNFGRNPLDMFHSKKVKSSHSVAIDISDYSLEILQLDVGRRVISHGRTVLEPGIVEDCEILKRDELVRVISVLFTKTRPHPIHMKRGELTAALSFPESKTFIHRVTLDSNIDKKDLRKEISKEVLKFIPFSSEDLLWDYSVLSEDGEKIEILYVGVLRELVEDYKSILEEVGVKLVLVDTELASVGGLFLSDENEEVGIAVIDIGARTTNIGVFDEKAHLVFSILIPDGGNDLTQKIIQKQNLTYSEAENLKRTHGFDISRGENDITPIIKEHFEDNIKYMKKALLYYERQTGEKVKKIILAGGGSLLPGIGKFLSEKLQIPTINKDPLFYVRRPHYIDSGCSILYANVIGLALRTSRDVKGINVLVSDSSLVETRHRFRHFRYERGYVYEKKRWVIWLALGINFAIIFLDLFLAF